MVSESPASVLFSRDGYDVVITDGYTIIPEQSGILMAGKNGSIAKFITLDSLGQAIVVGSGTAGSPSGGIITIQGIGSGTPVTVSGTVTVNQGTSPWVGNITQFGGSNIVTGIGSSGLGIPRITISNDSNILATQSGTWTVQQGNSPWTITGIASDNTTNSTVKLPVLSARANTSPPSWTDGYQVPLSTLLTGALRIDNTSWLGSTAPTVGQKTMVNSIPVVLSSDQTVIPVSDNGNSLTVDGTVTSNQGLSNTLANRWPVIITDGINTMPTGDIIDRSIFNKISDGYTGPVNVKGALSPPSSSDKALVVVISPNQQAIPVSSAPALAAPGLVTGKVTLGGSSANTLQVIRATTYNEQTSNGQRSVASSNVNDSSGGTGARKVEIIYFNSSGNGPFIEIIILNGTTPVATVATDICFIEKMQITEVGSVGSNIGTITLYVNNAGGGGTIGTIGVGNLVSGVGDNSTLWAHHYIPINKSASFATFIVAAYSGGSGTNATFYIKSKNPTNINDAEIVVSDVLLITASFTRILGIPLKIDGFSRVVAYGVPGVNNAILAASFDFAEL